MADGCRMEQHRWVLNYALFSLLNMFMTVSRSKLQRGGGAATEMGHKHRKHCPCSPCSSSPDFVLYALEAAAVACASSAVALSSARRRREDDGMQHVS